MKDTFTYNTLVARLSGKKTVKKRPDKREWSPEKKTTFHARMIAAREAKEKER